MIQESHKLLFYRTLSETKKLYEKVKYAIILSENFDPEREFYVASSNQMRSALDHIFKAMDFDEETMLYEMKEVEEHLNRAGYDAYEILASNICLNISNKMSLYSPPIISRVFPQYYCDIKPIISDIKVEIGQLRKDRKKSIDLSFYQYAKKINELIELDKLIDKNIPTLEIHRKFKKRETILYWGITIFIAFVAFIIGLFVK